MPGRYLYTVILSAVVAAAALTAGVIGFDYLDQRYPPDLTRLGSLSRQVQDREGRPLRTYLTAGGFHRLATTAGDVDPRYLKMLVAYEDKRFWRHPGIDLLALARAAGQALANGRIVSGASTLTMQTARLLEPRPRTFRSKLIEIFRALQLERRHDKNEILGMYLTLAPFGGNVEGVRAAAQVYFGRPPEALTLDEAALLVALPRAPSGFRPDRHPGRARAARNGVLSRAGPRMELDARAIRLAKAAPVPRRLRRMPFHSPHLADRLVRLHGDQQILRTTIDRALQRNLEGRARRWARELGPRTSVALLVVRNSGREVLAYVGSSDFGDPAREGQVDLVRALRSPGSTLKPIIYGLAFDRGLAHPATRINDAPTQFGDYAPANFMQRHMGDVSLAQALQHSLNVPAVAVLERLGPVALVERLRRGGLRLALTPADARPGLAVALGGVGTTLEDLTRLYAAIGDDGRLTPLRFLVDQDGAGVSAADDLLLRSPARWYLGEIMRHMPPPEGQIADRNRRRSRRIAYKTGTSYGFRDAWALGFGSGHTVGVWVGRADGVPSPGHFGANTAAPLLFQIFEQIAHPPTREPLPPADALPFDSAQLPPGLRRLGAASLPLPRSAGPPPRIVYPPDRSVLDVPPGGALALRAEGGRRPFTWLIDAVPIPTRKWARDAQWRPDGTGFSKIVLVDARGRRAEANVRFVDRD